MTINNIKNKFNIVKIYRELKIKSLIIYSPFSTSLIKLTNVKVKEVKKDNSTFVNVVSNKVEFFIDSPSFIELQRLISNNPINNNTQLLIEKFLSNQGMLVFKQELDKSLDVNYFKLNPVVLNYIKSYLNDLVLLVNNKKKMKSINKFSNYHMELLLNIDTNILISYMLGNTLKILSNNHSINNNSISSSVSINLAEHLVKYYLANLYHQFIGSNKMNTSLTSDTGKSYHVNKLYTFVNLNYDYSNYSMSSFINEHEKIKAIYDYFNTVENADENLVLLGMFLLDLVVEVNILKLVLIPYQKVNNQMIKQ